MEMKVHPTGQSREPIELALGEFALTIRGLDRDTAKAIALERLPILLQKGLRRKAFVLSLITRFEVDEFVLHYSERKSRNRVTLRVPPMPRLLAWLAFGVGISTADYSKAPENLEVLIEKAAYILDQSLEYVQETLLGEGFDLDIEYNPDIVLGRPPRHPDEDDDL